MDVHARGAGEKVLVSPQAADDLAAEIEAARRARPVRVDADPAHVERELARLALTVIEFLRRLLEQQALRRMESGSLTDEQVERMGQTFMRLERRMAELKHLFDLTDEELNLDLGPLGRLM